MLTNTMLFAAVAVASIVAVEAVLRVALPTPPGYFVIPPGTSWTIAASPGVVRGVNGVAQYRINSDGVRGRPFGDDVREFRLLAVGGSTTECVVLDESEVWTNVLERSLAHTTDSRNVWVGNVGKSGLTSREHVLHLKYLLPQYPHINVVVVLAGVNDMLGALKQGLAYRAPVPVTEPDGERRDLRRAFAVLPGMGHLPATDDEVVPWYRTTAIWDLARRAKRRWLLQRSVEPAGSEGLVRARSHRGAARVLDSLPSLDAPLRVFRKNLDVMADIAATRAVRLVFVTQPSAWRETMPEAQVRDLWLGWLGAGWGSAQAYYSTGALARAMESFNEVTRDVCRARGVECVDAAAMMPRDTTMFYDDAHFTEAGSRRLAAILAGHFASRPPFVNK
ncbi:MAG: GDSL-type esterase/lipase family protein [bacterium]